jgi:uncharacterized damage-inducible protein DinB
MIRDLDAFLDWFEGVHRRTVRDVSILPAEAERWKPGSTDEGEASWGVPDLVRHMAEARSYFAGAFLGNGWIWDTWPEELATKDTWAPALDVSMRDFRERLAGSGDRLEVRIELIANPGRTMSAWRALMMMTEHEIAHRAQIGTYAGLNGWPVAQIFDRTNEWVRAQREDERKKHGG